MAASDDRSPVTFTDSGSFQQLAEVEDDRETMHVYLMCVCVCGCLWVCVCTCQGLCVCGVYKGVFQREPSEMHMLGSADSSGAKVKLENSCVVNHRCAHWNMSNITRGKYTGRVMICMQRLSFLFFMGFHLTSVLLCVIRKCDSLLAFVLMFFQSKFTV